MGMPSGKSVLSTVLCRMYFTTSSRGVSLGNSMGTSSWSFEADLGRFFRRRPGGDVNHGRQSDRSGSPPKAPATPPKRRPPGSAAGLDRRVIADRERDQAATRTIPNARIQTRVDASVMLRGTIEVRKSAEIEVLRPFQISRSVGRLHQVRNENSCPNRPRLTVALPTCNGARHLREALLSIRAQERVAFDLIVSDDRSDDETLAIVREEVGDRARISVNSERLGLGWQLEPMRRAEPDRLGRDLPSGRRDASGPSGGTSSPHSKPIR